MGKLYPESEVELTSFVSRHYDILLDMITLGFYKGFIRKAVAGMKIREDDDILDLGCGTGRNVCLMYRYLKSGSVTGVDVSEIMGKQFMEKCGGLPGLNFVLQRIDIPFDLDRKFDKVFISFVLHGFPQQVREIVVRNAFDHLKERGSFHILDYGEFDLKKAPAYIRIPFKKIECKYAFDYIKRDWKAVLREAGFKSFSEHKLAGRYARLLTAEK